MLTRLSKMRAERNRRLIVETENRSRALIVDDSRAMRMILRKTLTELGYETCEAANGQEALVLLAQHGASFGLMLVDWNMPVMCGLDLVKAVRADTRYAAIPVVMVTTETEIQHISEALEAGANEYVMKPFTKDVLEDKLRSIHLIQ
jgi:two-component system chemotaxis response regulator CheY